MNKKKKTLRVTVTVFFLSFRWFVFFSRSRAQHCDFVNILSHLTVVYVCQPWVVLTRTYVVNAKFCSQIDGDDDDDDYDGNDVYILGQGNLKTITIKSVTKRKIVLWNSFFFFYSSSLLLLSLSPFESVGSSIVIIFAFWFGCFWLGLFECN